MGIRMWVIHCEDKSPLNSKKYISIFKEEKNTDFYSIYYVEIIINTVIKIFDSDDNVGRNNLICYFSSNKNIGEDYMKILITCYTVIKKKIKNCIPGKWYLLENLPLAIASFADISSLFVDNLDIVMDIFNSKKEQSVLDKHDFFNKNKFWKYVKKSWGIFFDDLITKFNWKEDDKVLFLFFLLIFFFFFEGRWRDKC
jgi:hypothetical protein